MADEIETPVGNIYTTTALEAFKTLSNMTLDQFLLAINDITTGDGAKITLKNFISSLVSTDSGNLIAVGVDKKLTAITPSNVISGETNYGGTISTNLDTIVKNGFYTCYGTAIGVPNSSYSWFVIHQNSNLDTNSATQRAVAVNSIPIIYERVKTSSIWGAWTSSSFADQDLSNLSVLGESKLNKSLPFSINSGKTDTDGNPDLLDITDTSKVVFKVDNGTSYAPLKGSLADGTIVNRTAIADLSVSALTDGIYNLFVGADGACVPLANTIYRQRKEPTTPVLNNVWLNTSVKPYVSKKWNGTTWEDFNYIPLPQTITVASGVIATINQWGHYNENGVVLGTIPLPDYSNSTSLISDTLYQADEDIFVVGTCEALNGTSRVTLSIKNANLDILCLIHSTSPSVGSGSNCFSSASAFIPKGYYYKFGNIWGTFTGQKYPLQGRS